MLGAISWAWMDWRAARTVGATEGDGVRYAEAGERLSHLARIDAQGEQKKEKLRERFERKRGEIEARKGGATVACRHAERELQQRQPAQRRKAAEFAACAAPAGPRTRTYAATIGAFAVVNLPADWTLAASLPMPLVLQILLTASIGTGLCFTADLAATKLEELAATWPDRHDEVGRFVQTAVAAGATLVGPQAVIVTFGQLRANSLTLIKSLVNPANAAAFHPAAINRALLAFQVLVFVGAVVVGLLYAQAEPRRRLVRELAAIDAEISGYQATLDDAEVVIAGAEEKLRRLAEQERKGLAAIAAMQAERRHRFEHIRRRYATRAARKRARKGPLASQTVGALVLTTLLLGAGIGVAGCGSGTPDVVALTVDVSHSTAAYRQDGGLYDTAALATAEHAAVMSAVLFAAPADGNSVADGAWQINGATFPAPDTGGNAALGRAERVYAARRLEPQLRSLVAFHGRPGSDLLGALKNVSRLFAEHPNVRHELVFLTDGGIDVGGIDLYHRPPLTTAARMRMIEALRREGRLPNLRAGGGPPPRVWIAGLGLGAPSRLTAEAIVDFWVALIPAAGGDLVAADSTLDLSAPAV